PGTYFRYGSWKGPVLAVLASVPARRGRSAASLPGRLGALGQRPLRALARAPRSRRAAALSPGTLQQAQGNNEDISFSRPADLDLIQSTPFKPLALKTPPRVLTLSERPLDFLDLERPPPTPQSEEIRAVGRLKRERSMSENAVRQNGQLVRNDSMYGISSLDAAVEGASEDMSVVDAASLRRQIIKLNRRLQLLEEENKERAKREMVMYSITVAFWLLNSWLWFRR
uniref:Mitochondrial fission factor n=1 Tax=Rattus norvegicus TaxID=10116 RepID=A0A140TAC2_RAT